MSTSSSPKAEDMKPKIHEQQGRPSSLPGHINLKIKSQDGQEVYFKVKGKTKWGKLKKTYCQHMSIKAETVAFIYDGKIIGDDETADQFEMEDGEDNVEISVMLLSDGGGATIHY